MGCGASSDKDDARGADKANRTNKTSKDATANSSGSNDKGGAAAKYAESASPIPSEVEILLEEMDRRVPSHCSSAGEEPSEAVKAMRFKAAVTRGKVVNGMNEDPNQFADHIDVPEFKRRDRRRVDEWTKLVAAAVGADGPEPIPEDTFLLAPSFSVAFTNSSTFQAADGKPLEPAVGRQRSSGGTNTHEFVDDSTESFSARRDNSSLDHVESGDLTRNESGESARAALIRKQQKDDEQKRSPPPAPPGVLLPTCSSVENPAVDDAAVVHGDDNDNDDDDVVKQRRQRAKESKEEQTDEVLLDQPYIVA